MRAIQLTPGPLRKSGPGCRTKRCTIELDLGAFDARLRKAALTAADWHINTLAAEPGAHGAALSERDRLSTWWWRHLAIGIADPSGCTVIWHGWYFLTASPGSRKICAILLGEETDDAILDLFDGRVSREGRLARARDALKAAWDSRSTVVDRLGSLLSESGVEQGT